MGIEDTVQVRCSRCKSKFRDKARRVRSGYSRQCPACECMVFFEDGSPNNDIQEALREAERVRKALREEEAENVAARSVVAEETADADAAPARSWRRIDRRSRPAGRTGR
jgi:predicted  nucleic acid-binding Zn-ribbon protein